VLPTKIIQLRNIKQAESLIIIIIILL